MDLIERLRSETPGVERMLHFDNAGSSLMARPIYDTVVAHLEREMMIGGYRAARDQGHQIEQVYTSISSLIGAFPDEIALVGSATRAWQLAFYSIPFEEGDIILTSDEEYASNFINILAVAKRLNVEVRIVESDINGDVSIEDLKSKCTSGVKLIAITHIPTNGGNINPAEEVGRIASDFGAFYLLDACQSVGHIEIDVKKIGCDFLCSTGRKFLRGPRGTGFLYSKRESLSRVDPYLLDLSSAKWVAKSRFDIARDAKCFEVWEKNYAAILGLGAAVDYALRLGMTWIEDRIFSLATALRSKLAELPAVELCEKGYRRGAIVTFRVRGLAPKEVCQKLAECNVNVSETTVFATRLDMERRGIDSLVRASVHYYNNETEIDRFCQILESL
ncbi:MAG: aminotransferase class V-fold PLP-dependent enzyme [Bdellovibrionales bacterium]|nr:aminotransferase class V-fold PLP-dependent enzyme [Bdellovibrionales bacterium]